MLDMTISDNNCVNDSRVVLNGDFNSESIVKQRTVADSRTSCVSRFVIAVAVLLAITAIAVTIGLILAFEGTVTLLSYHIYM